VRRGARGDVLRLAHDALLDEGTDRLLVDVLVTGHRVEVLDREGAVEDEDLGQGCHVPWTS
jgi:hypothetical protein